MATCTQLLCGLMYMYYVLCMCCMHMPSNYSCNKERQSEHSPVVIAIKYHSQLQLQEYCLMKLARKLLGFEAEFRKFSLYLVESFWFNSTILTVVAIDAICIGIQSSEYLNLKSGELSQVTIVQYQLTIARYTVCIQKINNVWVLEAWYKIIPVTGGSQDRDRQCQSHRGHQQRSSQPPMDNLTNEGATIHEELARVSNCIYTSLATQTKHCLETRLYACPKKFSAHDIIAMAKRPAQLLNQGGIPIA